MTLTQWTVAKKKRECLSPGLSGSARAMLVTVLLLILLFFLIFFVYSLPILLSPQVSDIRTKRCGPENKTDSRLNSEMLPC